MPSDYDVFISHCSADKVLAEKLVDILLNNGCNVGSDRILCTSLEGMGIPAGTDSFIQFLQEQIQGAKLVILLLTENYFASIFCVCEMGAAWGMGLNVFPLVVPPLSKSDLHGVLKVAQASDILEAASLDELRDVVRDNLTSSVKTARWNLKRDEFLKEARKIISKLPKPAKVDRSELTTAEENYAAALEELSVKNDEIALLNEKNKALGECKDAKQVKAVLAEFTDDEDQFKKLCEVAASALGQLRSATRSALYWHMRGGEFRPDRDDWDDVNAAEEIDELIDHEDNTCSANTEHPRVAKAEQALQELANFISEQKFDDKSPFVAAFLEEYEFPLSMGNKEFWGQFLAHV
jgi:hypothetical protein